MISKMDKQTTVTLESLPYDLDISYGVYPDGTLCVEEFISSPDGKRSFRLSNMAFYRHPYAIAVDVKEGEVKIGSFELQSCGYTKELKKLKDWEKKQIKNFLEEE